jgi:starch-binding outer membrane protein, SusD/RagB family
MKNKKIYFLAILTAAFISCESRLELEPKQSLDSNVVLTSESGVKQVLIGAYANLANGSLYGGRTQIMADLLGATGRSSTTHIEWYGTFAGFGDIYSKNMTNDNIFAEDLYRESYDAINATNIVLENANLIASATERKTAIAEAKFIQGLVYFDLVRFFALPFDATTANSQLGVIIRPKAIYQYQGADLSAERNTVAQVYTTIISSLNDAYNDLPASNGEFATKYAAQALLARVYLQQQNYPAALTAANDAINNGGYSLSTSLGAAYNHETKQGEDVFSIAITSQTGDNQINNSYASTQNGGRGGDIAMGSGYFSLFTDINDKRRSFWYTNSFGDRLTLKFTNQFADVNVIRFAELLLIRAEANARLNSAIGDTPLNDVNKIRTRAGAANLSTATVAQILTERQLELAFEGFWIHDLKRTKTSIVGTSKTWTYDNPMLVFPIPLRELNTNKLITKNPGY